MPIRHYDAVKIDTESGNSTRRLKMRFPTGASYLDPGGSSNAFADRSQS